MFPTSPENVTAIECLYEALAAVPSDGIVTYAALDEISGCETSGKHRHLLHSARERAEKELGCIFDAVRTVGIKRLPASAGADVGLSAIRRVRKAAKRGARRIGRINSNSLTEAERKRVISYDALLRTIALVADGNKARTIAAVVDPVNPIPPQSILEMFATK